MIRLSITASAFDAICATLPLGTVGYGHDTNERGERHVRLEDAMVDRLGAMRGPGDYSAVILRIAGRESSFDG